MSASIFIAGVMVEGFYFDGVIVGGLIGGAGLVIAANREFDVRS